MLTKIQERQKYIKEVQIVANYNIDFLNLINQYLSSLEIKVPVKLTPFYERYESDNESEINILMQEILKCEEYPVINLSNQTAHILHRTNFFSLIADYSSFTPKFLICWNMNIFSIWNYDSILTSGNFLYTSKRNNSFILKNFYSIKRQEWNSEKEKYTFLIFAEVRKIDGYFQLNENHYHNGRFNFLLIANREKNIVNINDLKFKDLKDFNQLDFSKILYKEINNA